jgi:hypothetical protein
MKRKNKEISRKSSKRRSGRGRICKVVGGGNVAEGKIRR